MRRRYIWRDGDWLDVTDWKRAPHVGPYIIRDGMPDALHPANGATYDSKSAFRAATRAAGMIEMGTDAPMTPAPRAEMPPVADSVREAVTMLEQGYVPPPLESVLDAMPGEIRTYPTENPNGP